MVEEEAQQEMMLFLRDTDLTQLHSSIKKEDLRNQLFYNIEIFMKRHRIKDTLKGEEIGSFDKLLCKCWSHIVDKCLSEPFEEWKIEGLRQALSLVNLVVQTSTFQYYQYFVRVTSMKCAAAQQQRLIHSLITALMVQVSNWGTHPP